MSLRRLMSAEPRSYTGEELRSHFLRHTFGLEGDAACAFVGPCDVPCDHMVDLEDRTAGRFIFSRRMLHLLIEHFGLSLREAVLRQRLLTRLAADGLREKVSGEVRVRGDDLFVEGRKASVSIATLSPVSALVHFGLNVQAEGAPVPAWGLEEAALDALDFGSELLRRYDEEIVDVQRATTKVRGVP